MLRVAENKGATVAMSVISREQLVAKWEAAGLARQ
jgi:hypothetical protein